jgi:integrase
MAVPERYRASAGKREWKFSLDETDEARARVKHAERLVEVRRWMANVDAQALVSTKGHAEAIVSRGLEVLAKSNANHFCDLGEPFDAAQGLDNVLHTMLVFLAFRVRLAWGGKHATAAREEVFGSLHEDVIAAEPLEAEDVGKPGTAFQSFDERKAATAAMQLFEGQHQFRCAGLREIARGILAARDWSGVAVEAEIVAGAAGASLPERGVLFEAVAEQILKRLAEHRFAHWPCDPEAMITSVTSQVRAPRLEHAPAPAQQPFASEILAASSADPGAGTTLSDLHKKWRGDRGLADGVADKTSDEWQVAIRRFRELMGTEDVTLITTTMVTKFRDKCSRLPSRPARTVAQLTAEKQIQVAEENQLVTLSPPTVGKMVGAIKSLLSVAVEDPDCPIAVNVASGVTVEGAKHLGIEREHFTDAEMKLIYESSLMTDPDACSDTMFWILFLAPFHGSRPGEHCKVRPGEIVQDDDGWVIQIRSDGRRRSQQVRLADGQRPRRLKTLASYRDVPIHWILELAGFVDFARLQKERGAEWLFDDLEPDAYGDRYKYLSRKINGALRSIGITDPDKSFYSTRHSMKREGRKRRISEMNLNQIAGHALASTGERYGQGVPVQVLKEDIDRLEFRSVDWNPVVECGLARLRRLSVVK